MATRSGGGRFHAEPPHPQDAPTPGFRTEAATDDEHLLCVPASGMPRADAEWVGRIAAEVGSAFARLAAADPAVSVFGSARTKPGDPEYPDGRVGPGVLRVSLLGLRRRSDVRRRCRLDASIRFARGAGGHAAALDVAEAAQRAGIGRLVFAHIGRPTIRAIESGAKPLFGELGVDGDVWCVESTSTVRKRAGGA